MTAGDLEAAQVGGPRLARVAERAPKPAAPPDPGERLRSGVGVRERRFGALERGERRVAPGAPRLDRRALIPKGLNWQSLPARDGGMAGRRRNRPGRLRSWNGPPASCWQTASSARGRPARVVPARMRRRRKTP